MRTRTSGSTTVRWLAAAAGVVTGAYAAYVATTWTRYGRVSPTPPASPSIEDGELNRLMPRYEVVERHAIVVEAPAAVTLGSARSMDMGRIPLVRAIFRGRELIMGSDVAAPSRSRGFVEDMLALGWGLLSETDHQIVMGGITKPWQANPVFRAVPGDDFANAAEPDSVKIVFTLRADPLDAATSLFRTETRAVATDAAARDKFRWYWAFLSPGILLIRWALLRPLKAEAERAARARV